MPYNCLSLKSNPMNTSTLKELVQIYIFHQVDLYDVALLGADLQEKDLKEELDLGLVLLVHQDLGDPFVGLPAGTHML